MQKAERYMFPCLKTTFKGGKKASFIKRRKEACYEGKSMKQHYA